VSCSAIFLPLETFTTFKIGGEEDDAILQNKMRYIFTSPESLLNGKWRDWVTNNASIKLIAVDEAHTVLHW
jgi:superfamily II DNA helicase RecQ